MRARFVGTSGYASPALRSHLPTERASPDELLVAYAVRHRSVEIPSSFTRPPSRDTVSGWVGATDERFTFAVCMCREATHVLRLGAPDSVAGFLGVLAPLGPRLGCVLFTIPPSLGCDVGAVRAVLDVVPPGVRTAWEFRHPSWQCPDVLDLLVQRGAAPVIVETLEGISSGELLPGGAMTERWELPFVYVRLRKERYRAREVMAWGDVLREALSGDRDVFAFFRQSEEAGSYASALDEMMAEEAGASVAAVTPGPVPAGAAL